MSVIFQLTGSLSDGLWSASSDSKSIESREAMRAERHHQSSGDHLVAGIKGLGMGLVGGLTSIVTQPIEGASEKGVPVSCLIFPNTFPFLFIFCFIAFLHTSLS